MEYPINKKVLIRTKTAGIFFGTLVDYDAANKTAKIADCRRIWYWDGAATLSQMAVEGVKSPDKCKFSMVVTSIIVMEVIEILPCTEASVTSIESVKIWKV